MTTIYALIPEKFWPIFRFGFTKVIINSISLCGVVNDCYQKPTSDNMLWPQIWKKSRINACFLHVLQKTFNEIRVTPNNSNSFKKFRFVVQAKYKPIELAAFRTHRFDNSKLLMMKDSTFCLGPKKSRYETWLDNLWFRKGHNQVFLCNSKSSGSKTDLKRCTFLFMLLSFRKRVFWQFALKEKVAEAFRGPLESPNTSFWTYQDRWYWNKQTRGRRLNFLCFSRLKVYEKFWTIHDTPQSRPLDRFVLLMWSHVSLKADCKWLSFSEDSNCKVTGENFWSDDKTQ